MCRCKARPFPAKKEADLFFCLGSAWKPSWAHGKGIAENCGVLNESERWKFGHRYALFHDQEFHAAVKEHQRRARQFVSGVILECHDKCQDIAQELRTIHIRHEGQICPN